MSYSQEDKALETCLAYATVDIGALDPDQLAELAERFTAKCREIRDHDNTGD